MNNDKQDNKSFLSATIRSAEAIVSNGTQSAKHYINTFLELRDNYKKASRMKQLAPMARSAPGGFSANLMLVGGWVLLGLCLMLGLTEYLIFHVSWQTLLLVSLIPAALGVYLIVKGIKKSRYVDTYAIYRVIFSEQPYISIAKLAQMTNTSKGRVIKYLQDYQLSGLYPEGHFYRDNTYYVMSNAAAELLDEELAEKRQEKENRSLEKVLADEYPKLYEMSNEIDESLEALGALQESETADNNPQLKRELRKMRRILGQIKTYILKNPSEVPDIRSVINYFLPTVTKLLGSYYELDNERVQTENIKTSKAEIESVLESINLAFENMYDDFYTDKAIDIYADVSVLKTLIEKHGLSDSNFS